MFQSLQSRCRAQTALGALCAGFFLSLSSAGVWAQPGAADHQEWLRQQERERVLRQQHESAPDVRLERPAAPAEPGRLPTTESPCFNIERILLAGDAAEQFQWALAGANSAADGLPDAASGR